MSFRNNNQQGVAPLFIVVAAVVIAAVLGVGYLAGKHSNKTDDRQASVIQSTSTKKQAHTIQSTAAPKATLSTVTDPDKKAIIIQLTSVCGNGAQQGLIDNSNSADKFVIRGYFARVNTACNDGGGFVAYLSKDDVGKWTIIEKTQQAPNCKYWDNEVGVSADIVTTCYDATTLKERQRQ